MNIVKKFWEYWKWLCVALVTTCIVLGVLTLIINHFKASAPPRAHPAAQCLDAGGTWNAEKAECRYPA